MPMPTIWSHTPRDLRKGARLFLRYARMPISSRPESGQDDVVDPVLLTAFRDWMRQQRGTCDATLYNYSLSIRDLLKTCGEDPGRFDAQNLRQFVLDTSQRCGWAAAKKCTTASACFCVF